MNNTFTYFEQLLKIPRPSGHEDKIADFLVEFAQVRGLEVYRDNFNNVLINKNNNSDKTIILQGHTDMVCDCVDNIIKDFVNEPIKWKIEDGFYKGDNTTLGADNGIGVAIILSLLDETGTALPNIQALFTTQEETTMNGAKNFDYSKIHANTLLSIDGIKEGNIESSSAGICNYKIHLPKPTKLAQEKIMKCVTLSGLQGGHSGDDINKNRENAICLLFKHLPKTCLISKMFGGSKSNVIPNHAEIVFVANETDKTTQEQLRKLYPNEPNLIWEGRTLKSNILYSEQESKKIVELITNLQTGTISVDEDNFPITSANLGTLSNEKSEYSIRSSDKTELAKVKQNAENLCKKLSFEYELVSEAPFFPFNPASRLRECLQKTYKRLYGKNTNTVKVHACMEGGIFADNIPNADIVVISPDVFDIHTTKERVNISSTNRVYDWILESLKNL